MVPKKADEFKKDVADELNLSESIVNKIVDLYWETVRKNMTSLSDPAIEILNFGTFKVKHWGIDNEINKYNNIIKAKEKTFNGYHIKIELEKRIAAMEKIKQQVLEEKEKFKEIKKTRNDKKNKDNLEE